MALQKGLYNKTKNKPVVAKVDLATTFFKRLKGLLGTNSLEEDRGLFLSPCKSIHMFGMKYSIDAVFLNKDLKVVELVEDIQPGAVSGHYPDALSCLELAQGTIGRVNLEIGDQLEWLE